MQPHVGKEFFEDRGEPRAANAQPSIAKRYGGAVLIIAVATLLGWWFEPLLTGSGFMIYFAAVVIASWLGGLGPSLLALTSSLLISIWLFEPAPGSVPDPPLKIIAGLGVYFFVGVTTALLSESMRSARRRAEALAVEALRQREQMRTTLACIGDAVIVTDCQGRLTMMNPIAESLTGWQTADAVGKPLDAIFRISNEQTGATVENPVERVLREGTIVGLANHTVLHAKDGGQRPIDDSAAPVRDAQGSMLGVVLIFRDVSERRRVEQALRDADRRKDEFLAVLSHELRNPLAPIRMATEVLRLPAVDAAQAAWAHEVIDRQVQHLVRLVDDLLDVSRIMRGKIEMRKEPTDIRTILSRATEIAQPLIDEKQHQLTVEAPPEKIMAHVDPVRLVQVVGNLLTNAAKYTQPQGRIWLSSERADHEAIICVRDTGMGIPAELMPQVFELFIQGAPSANGSQGGLGIGLTLVKKLVELNDGRVEVASDGPGTGTEFVIRLPIAESTVAEPQSDGPSPVALQSRRVLVVDDNADAAEALAMLLRLKGHDVECCQDGPSALDAVKIRRPEFVFLDLGMPGMDGLEVARRLRSEPEGSAIVIVAVTGWGQEADRRRTADAGFDHHLVKPVSAADVHRLLACEAEASRAAEAR
ncbi:MAG TPA: ATP-binding protein [Pirellulales bacterium]|nr:ATP-binding protein [Pirellulales bacterium]